MSVYCDLLELRDNIMDLILNISINQAYLKNGLKIYNPHCPNWSKCKRDSLNKDCFICGTNLKGSEQYVLEKLIDKLLNQ